MSNKEKKCSRCDEIIKEIEEDTLKSIFHCECRSLDMYWHLYCQATNAQFTEQAKTCRCLNKHKYKEALEEAIAAIGVFLDEHPDENHKEYKKINEHNGRNYLQTVYNAISDYLGNNLKNFDDENDTPHYSPATESPYTASTGSCDGSPQFSATVSSSSPEAEEQRLN